MKILSVIITFHPDYTILNENIKNLESQVDSQLIVNNGPFLDANQLKVPILTIENHNQGGIAGALNIALDYAYHENYSYLLTMDQDSHIPLDYVKHLKKCFSRFPHAGIVGANIIEKALGTRKISNVTVTKEVTHVISSGSLNLVDALILAGRFDEKLFIDMVDLDICYRVSDCGYKIIQSSDVLLEHQIGNPEIKRFLFKNHYVRNHHPLRKYFFVRNRLYLAFRYRKRGWKFVFLHLLGIAYYIFIILLFEKQKVLKLKMIGLGFLDFICGNYSNKIVQRWL